MEGVANLLADFIKAEQLLPGVSAPRLIHVRLYRKRFWEAFEREGVEPFYLEKEHAISYAEQRGRLGNATVRIYDEHRRVEREITPPVDSQMLYAPHVKSSIP